MYSSHTGLIIIQIKSTIKVVLLVQQEGSNPTFGCSRVLYPAKLLLHIKNINIQDI